jgi:hypothetical protein
MTHFEGHNYVVRLHSAVIMIDDLAVPHDAGYTYDDYGPGKALNLEYLGSVAEFQLSMFWPKASSRWETGAKRGCIVLTNNLDMREGLRELPCLREV